MADGAAIEFGERQRGTRAYLAVSGGIAVTPVLGSRSTDIRSGLGGLDGRRLQKGDRLPVGATSHVVDSLRNLASPSWLGEEPELRVLGASDDSPVARELFLRLCDAHYRLAAASDRTGYRLMADRPLPEAEATMLSQPVVTGAIQLPPGGSPLLLMADWQTTGGYTIVAVVTAADLPLAGQLGPGDSCRFVPCEWEQARSRGRRPRARSRRDGTEDRMTSSEALTRLQAALERALGPERVTGNRPLAPMTTFKVGGPADLFVEPRSSEEIVLALRLAHDSGVPVTMLGGGSNVLVADAGIRGLVLRPRGGHIAREDDTRVRADAAVTINGLVRWLISHGLAGLEAWAGTPGTVGGGIYGNAHWAGRLLSDVVVGVRLAPSMASSATCRRRDGIWLRPKPAATDGRGAAVGAVRGVGRGSGAIA